MKDASLFPSRRVANYGGKLIETVRIDKVSSNVLEQDFRKIPTSVTEVKSLPVDESITLENSITMKPSCCKTIYKPLSQNRRRL